MGTPNKRISNNPSHGTSKTLHDLFFWNVFNIRVFSNHVKILRTPVFRVPTAILKKFYSVDKKDFKLTRALIFAELSQVKICIAIKTPVGTNVETRKINIFP